MVVGTQLNAEDLAKRRNYKYVNRVTLKSNLAAAMLRKAGLLEPRPGARLLDMFCGSGTVLLEWSALVNGERKGERVPIEAVGIDVSLGAVEGARANAEAEGASADCRFIKCDAKAMRAQLEDGSFDAIVTNVPWGVQTGNDAKVDLEKLYEMVLRNAWHLLRPKGRVVFLVRRPASFAAVPATNAARKTQSWRDTQPEGRRWPAPASRRLAGLVADISAAAVPAGAARAAAAADPAAAELPLQDLGVSAGSVLCYLC